ncbi:heme-degrading domain-containing protein [Devosia sp.]|uniref:heme-degrading domain-containing protein n=1 Tax=Devosia sp. TaxID=1871048 RepID=UPI003BA8C796
MAAAEDIAKIIEQEQGLVFAQFDESMAFSLGARVRERAVREKLGLVVDIRTWDRPMFYCAMPGTTADNPEWVRRKFNVVRRLQKSTYRLVLEQNREDRLFPPTRALDAADYVLAGGGFPLRIKGFGPIGCLTISGLHERDDHQVAVDAVCEELGLDKAAFTLAK